MSERQNISGRASLHRGPACLSACLTVVKVSGASASVSGGRILLLDSFGGSRRRCGGVSVSGTAPPAFFWLICLSFKLRE